MWFPSMCRPSLVEVEFWGKKRCCIWVWVQEKGYERVMSHEDELNKRTDKLPGQRPLCILELSMLIISQSAWVSMKNARAQVRVYRHKALCDMSLLPLAEEVLVNYCTWFRLLPASQHDRSICTPSSAWRSCCLMFSLLSPASTHLHGRCEFCKAVCQVC